MKKLILLVLITIAISESAWAQRKADFCLPDINGKNIYYAILSNNEKTVTVTGGKKIYKKTKSLVIPSQITYNNEKYTVVEIDEKAFGNKVWGGCDIKNVSLPPTVKRIGKEAFAGCHFLNINFSEGLEEIGESAFYNSFYSAPSIAIPKSVKVIGKDAFAYSGSFGVTGSISAQLNMLPSFVTEYNCEDFGISTQSVAQYWRQNTNAFANNTQPIRQVSIETPSYAVPENNQFIALEDNLSVESDVDKDIPTVDCNNENTFILIFANENYQNASNVDYALHDGEIFKRYCQQLLGVSDENIKMVKDATYGQMTEQINWISRVAKAYQGDAKIVIYYAGHGIPNEKDGSAYLLPIDVSGDNTVAAYSLNRLYSELGALNAKSITIFMDACFSGSSRGEGMLVAARGVAIAAKTELPTGNMVVFSATQGDETAYPYAEKGHGLFTYYLLKKLKDTKGNVDYGTLGDYIRKEVERKSIVVNNKPQTPTVSYAPRMADTWKSMKLR